MWKDEGLMGRGLIDGQRKTIWNENGTKTMEKRRRKRRKRRWRRRIMMRKMDDDGGRGGGKDEEGGKEGAGERGGSAIKMDMYSKETT